MSQNFQFGILASHQYLPDDDVGRRLDELWRQTELGAELGFASIFAINHFLGNLQTPQTLTVAGELVRRSGSMTVGTSVLILPAYHPVQVAEEFATLDHLARGRLVLGVGAGYRRNEFEAFGIDKEGRFRQLGEAVRLIRALWTGGEVELAGEFYRVSGQRIGIRPFQTGGPPIWIGAGGPFAIKRAAQLGDAWILPGNAPSEGWYERSMAQHDEALAAAGKSREGRQYPMVCSVFCGSDGDAARAHARPYVQSEYFTYAEYPQLKFQRERFEFLWNERFLIGSPDEIASRLEALRELGVNHLIGRFSFLGMPAETVLASMRLFAQEVIPRFGPVSLAAGPSNQTSHRSER